MRSLSTVQTMIKRAPLLSFRSPSVNVLSPPLCAVLLCCYVSLSLWCIQATNKVYTCSYTSVDRKSFQKVVRGESIKALWCQTHTNGNTKPHTKASICGFTCKYTFKLYAAVLCYELIWQRWTSVIPQIFNIVCVCAHIFGRVSQPNVCVSTLLCLAKV